MRVPLGFLFQSVRFSTHATLWPYLPRLMPRPIKSIGLGTPEAAELYVPGQHVRIVVADCAGTDELAGPGRWSIASIGLATGTVPDHVRALGAMKHAACHRGRNGSAPAVGFDIWHARPVAVTLDFDPDSPVWATPEGLRVCLPATMTRDEFACELRDALEVVAVDVVIASAKGRQRCHDLGLAPGRYLRETEHVVAGRRIKARVEDLFFFRTLLDGDALAAIVETIVAAHLVDLAQGTGLPF